MKKQRYAVLNTLFVVCLVLLLVINIVGTLTLTLLKDSNASQKLHYEEQLNDAEQRVAHSDACMREAVIAGENAIMMCEELKLDCEQLREYNAVLQAENEELRKATSLDYIVRNPVPPRYFDIALDEDLQDYIWMLCCEYDIVDHYGLVYAMIAHESNFDASAVSETDDWGLMQINSINHNYLAETLGITDFLDPYQNVHCGIYLISTLLHRYDVADALMAYNMGESSAAKLWQRGIHSTGYSSKILAQYEQFR